MAACYRTAPMLTLAEVLRDRAERDGDRVMFDFADRSYTYREVQARADTWQLILSDAGAQPNERVVFLSANRPEFVFALYGALQLGAAVVLCSPAWKAGEIAHACDVVAPHLAVADAAGRATLAEAAPELLTLAVEDPPVLSGHVNLWQVDDIDADAVLVFSSGTTGFPKAVRHTHRSMGHGVQHWITALGLTDSDRFQIATPPVHILGLLNIFTAVAAGARFRLHAAVRPRRVVAHGAGRTPHARPGGRAHRARAWPTTHSSRTSTSPHSGT